MTTYFDWDTVEDNIGEEYDDAGLSVADYTTEPDRYGNVISQRRGGQSSFFHFDALGSTLAVTDQGQSVTDTRAYSAFGETTESAGSITLPVQYLGQRGFYYSYDSAEYYDRETPYSPSTGRWLSANVETILPPVPVLSVLDGPQPPSNNSPLFASQRLQFLGSRRTLTFTAGADLSKRGCPRGQPKHTVTYSLADVAWCRSYLAGGAVFSSLPCAACLLSHFLTNDTPGTTFSCAACREALRGSSWVQDTVRAMLSREIFSRRECCSSYKVTSSLQLGGPCMDPFKNLSGKNDQDLTYSIGAVDKAEFSVAAQVDCGPESKAHPPCCSCTTSGTGRLVITDEYDFISTLPKSAPVRGAVWCAAIIEHRSGGRNTFTAKHEVELRVATRETLCDYTREE